MSPLIMPPNHHRLRKHTPAGLVVTPAWVVAAARRPTRRGHSEPGAHGT
jgi:hypothetical protein